MQSQRQGEPRDRSGVRSYPREDLASPLPLPLPLPHAGLGRAHGEAAGARRRKEGIKPFPRWGPGWHPSSLPCAPGALPGPCWLPAAPLQLPPPRPPAGTASLPGLLRWQERLPRAPGAPGSRLPVSSACFSLRWSPGHLPGEFSRE